MLFILKLDNMLDLEHNGSLKWTNIVGIITLGSKLIMNRRPPFKHMIGCMNASHIRF